MIILPFRFNKKTQKWYRPVIYSLEEKIKLRRLVKLKYEQLYLVMCEGAICACTDSGKDRYYAPNVRKVKRLKFESCGEPLTHERKMERAKELQEYR